MGEKITGILVRRGRTYACYTGFLQHYVVSRRKRHSKRLKKEKKEKKKKESFAPDLDQLERHRLALTETAVGQNRRKKAKISMSFLVISYFYPGQIVQDKTSSAVKNSVKSVAPDQFCRIVF